MTKKSKTLKNKKKPSYHSTVDSGQRFPNLGSAAEIGLSKFSGEIETGSTHSNLGSMMVSDSMAAMAPSEHEERLLNQARSYWQFGEWSKLADLKMDAITSHPERAKLALLVATGYQQLGQLDAVCHLVAKAHAWGISKQQITKMLLAGTYHTLGRAAVLSGTEARSERLFRKSIDVAMPGAESHLWQPIRREIAERELLNMVVSDKGYFSRLCFTFEAMRRCGGILGAKPPFKIDVPSRANNKQRTVIVIAGMRHSGSTALFNIVREALELSEIEFRSGYSELVDFRQAHGEPVLLIKTHELRDDLLEEVDMVLTTVRDLRNSVASAKRRVFPLLKSLGVVEYAKLNRQLHELWAPLSSYEFPYERFMADPLPVICEVLDLLCLDQKHLSSIHQAVHHLPTDQYEKTLLSSTHITDPQRIHSYQDTLTMDEIDQIERVAGAWLRRGSYL